MKTQRALNAIKNAGKAICLSSNASDRTDSSEKGPSAKTNLKVDMEVDIEAMTTQFTNMTSGETQVGNAFKHSDVDMEFEKSTGFSFDSEMADLDQTMHSKVVSEYCRAIVNNLKTKETTMNGNLDKHEIQGSHRKQMVVWMEEVLSIFKCPTDVYFLAISIMDRYLEASSTKLVLDELHEIGIVSMFIASKYIEVEPLTLDLMIAKVAHDKISEKQILIREKTILKALKFKLGKPQVHDFIESYIELFSDRFESDEIKTQILADTIRVAKNGMSDRRIAFTILPSETALCSLIIAIKDYSRSTKKVVLDDSFSKAIKSELTSDETLVLQFGKRLRKLALERIF
jgi:hypothetical protein